MNGYLIDTNVALLAVFRSASLSTEVRDALERGANYLSVIVYWEVMLKSMKGALKVGDPRIWWFDALEQLAAGPLALRPEHVTACMPCRPSTKILLIGS